ncbi:MAG TPA: NADH-quinone oxidoreductase subunit C [Abditibacteriaceae bacterium]
MANNPRESSGAYLQPTERASHAVEKLQEQFADVFFEVRRFRDETTVYVPRERIVEVCTFLKTDAEMNYNYLSDLTGNDWPDRDPRFEVIYQLYSVGEKGHYTYLRLKVRVPEDDCVCPSVTSVWRTSNWHEREVHDMFGIKFEGHPDLRKILLPEEFVGHPLRQDFEIGWEEPEFSVRKIQREYAKS